MIRVLFFLLISFNVSFSLEVHNSLFPKGEDFKKIIVNEAIGKKVLFSPRRKISFIQKDWSDFRINFIDIDKKKIFFQLNDGFINNIAMAKDSSYIAYEINVDYEKPVILKILDIKTKKIIQTFPLENKLKSLSISPDGKYIVCLSEDNKIFSFSVDEKKLKFVFSLPNVKKIKIAVSNNYIVIKKNKSISLHNIKTGQEIKSFNIEYDYFSKIDISNDDKYILFYDYRNVKIWDIKNKNIISNFIVSDIKDIKFMNDSNKIIYVEKDRLKIFDIKKEKNIFSLKDNNFKKIDRLFLLKNDRKVLVNSQFLVDLKTFEIENIIDGLNCLNVLNKKKACFLEESKIVFSIDNGKGLKAWNLKENSLEYIIDKEDRINDMILDKKKKYLIFSSNKNLKIWDIEEQEIINKYQDKNSTIQDLSISDSGNLIAFKVDTKIKIIDFQSLKLIQEIEYPFEISRFRFIEDKYLILGKYEKIDIFDIKSAQKLRRIDNKQGFITIFNDSRYCRISSYSKNSEEIEIKETLTNKVVLSNFPKNEYIYSIENHNIYTYCEDTNKSYIWDLKEEKKIREIKDKPFSATNDRKSIIIHDGDEEEIKKIFYNNDYWAILDYQTKKIYRYSDKNFILDTKTYQPILPKLQEVLKDDLEMFFDTKSIKLINNEDSIFNIQVKNLSNHKLYWIEPIIDDENFTIKTNSIVVLEPNEIKSVQVSILYNKFIEQSFSKDLTLNINVGNDVVKAKKIKVEIKKIASIELENIKLEDEGISIKFKKFIDTNLTNLKVTLSEGNKSIENYKYYDYSFPPIETNSSIKVYLPSQGIFYYSWGKEHNFTVTISADEIHSYTFKRDVKFDMPAFISISILILIVMVLLIPYIWYIGLFNKNINKIMSEGLNKIIDTPLKKLPHYKKVLKRSLKKKDFESYFIKDFDEVVKFFEIDNEGKANIFAQRTKGKLEKINNNLFEIQLSTNFELPLDTFLLYFVDYIDINQIYNELKDKRANAIIVIGQNEKEQQSINENNQLSKLPNVIGLSPKDLKIFLLKKEHTKSLAQIFATKIDRTLISPYQAEGQVENELYFFGREKIIDNIYSKEVSNYFIVGARQIGKSSLLKALERKFEDREDIICIAFEDTRYLLKEMATSLGLDRNSSLEKIEVFISNSSKSYLFLIDEVDAFIKKEKENNYEMLHAFRALSQRKKAFFIMAGYWELFSQISFDYYSPIKNFGETIKLGKLEWKACSKLITLPMDNLKLDYKLVDDAVEILVQTGQRANLIAMVCDKIVKDLKPLSFEITREDIDNALHYNDELQKTYFSWRDIPDNKRQSYITQIIVYASVKVDAFSLEGIVELFESLALSNEVTLDEIDESLQRLELMYIIEKNKHNVYWYTIPLMKEELIKDSEIRLNRIVSEFRRKYMNTIGD